MGQGVAEELVAGPRNVRELRGAVEWRDLVPLTRWEKARELALSLPWLAGSWWCYQRGWWWAGMTASFFFFLTGLRQSHNAQHYAMGLPRPLQDAVLCVLSVLMLGSMHAVQVTHLHHHRHCLDEQDIEAGHANERWWRVLLTGPAFPVRLHVAAWRMGTPEKRAWIAAEMALMTLGAAAALAFGPAFLRWHVAAMVCGECFTGFFAVWTVHHGCDEHTVARTQRGWVKNFVSYSMFYHLEHHLFPAVPTTHLPRLAERLDAVAPEVRTRLVI
jgi:fatty acid desaturase